MRSNLGTYATLTKLVIDTAEVFAPLLAPSRYKGAWGGRRLGEKLVLGRRDD